MIPLILLFHGSKSETEGFCRRRERRRRRGQLEFLEAGNDHVVDERAEVGFVVDQPVLHRALHAERVRVGAGREHRVGALQQLWQPSVHEMNRVSRANGRDCARRRDRANYRDCARPLSSLSSAETSRLLFQTRCP